MRAGNELHLRETPSRSRREIRKFLFQVTENTGQRECPWSQKLMAQKEESWEDTDTERPRMSGNHRTTGVSTDCKVTVLSEAAGTRTVPAVPPLQRHAPRASVPWPQGCGKRRQCNLSLKPKREV